MDWFELFCGKMVTFELNILYENRLTSIRCSTILKASMLGIVCKLQNSKVNLCPISQKSVYNLSRKTIFMKNDEILWKY